MSNKKMLNFKLSGFNYAILVICLAASGLFLLTGNFVTALSVLSVVIVLFIIYAFSKGRAATEYDRLSEFEPADEREILILRRSSTIAIKFSVLTGVICALALTGFFNGSLSSFGLSSDLTLGLLAGALASLGATHAVYLASAGLLSWASNRK